MSNIKLLLLYFRACVTIPIIAGGMIITSTAMSRAQSPLGDTPRQVDRFFFNYNYFDRVQVGVGGSAVVPNIKMTWQGTGVPGGAISTTLSSPVFMPVIQATIPLNTFQIGTWPVLASLEADVMIGTGQTQTQNFTAGVFAGTNSFRERSAETFFFNFSIPIIDPLTGTAFVGGGVAVNTYEVKSTVPAAGDFFQKTQTDVVPALQQGVNLLLTGPGSANYFPLLPPGTNLELKTTEIAPGGQFTLPGGNSLSYTSANPGWTFAWTAKLNFPIGQSVILAPAGPRPSSEGYWLRRETIPRRLPQ